jgi:hypothetical protein
MGDEDDKYQIKDKGTRKEIKEFNGGWKVYSKREVTRIKSVRNC